MAPLPDCHVSLNWILNLLPLGLQHPASVRARAMRLAIERSRMVAGPPLVRMKVPRVVAVHFPKAGGTSLLQQLAAILRSDLAMDYGADPLAGPSGARPFPPGKAMVIGHFRPCRYDSADAFRFTFLRHPVTNIISTYFFLKTVPDRGHPMHHRFLMDRPTLIEFARDARIRHLMTETYFGGFDMGRMDFIGFNETRAQDLARLSDLLGIPLSAEVHANRTTYGEANADAQRDGKLRAQLTDILAADIAFYERMRSLAGR
jgi:hypothetical protein